MECCAPFSVPNKRDTAILQRVQQRASRIIEGLEHLFYEERLRELELFSPEKKRLRRMLPSVHKYPVEENEEEGAGLFPAGLTDRLTEQDAMGAH